MVVGVFLIVFLLTATEGRVQAIGGPHAQLLFILQQPMGFLGILWSNMQSNLLWWTVESIGVLGWLNVFLPPAFYLVVLVAGSVLFIRMGEGVRLQAWRRALLAAVGVAVFLTLAVALYAFLEPMGSDRVYFQGRYLAPVWLLLLLSAYGTPFVQRRRGVPLLVGVALVMMVGSLNTLITFYRA